MIIPTYMAKRHRLVVFLSFAVSCSLASPLGIGAVWHVAKELPGEPERDGKTWETAFVTITEGIATAQDGDEVWVAAGTYRETIQLRAGLALYGGFNGAEVDLSDRDWKQNETTISANGNGSQ